MKILGYFLPLRGMEYPTGVSQHAIHMFAGLATRLGENFCLCFFKDSGQKEAEIVQARCGQVHLQQLGYREAVAYHLGTYLGWRILEKISAKFDWVYAPKELPIRSRNLQVAVTVHDVLPLERAHDWHVANRSWSYHVRWRWIFRNVVRYADIILTVSEFTKTRLLDLFPKLPPERVRVVGNGVSNVFFDPSLQTRVEVVEKYGLTPGQYVMFSGGLIARKGAEIVLETAKLLFRNNSDLVVAITGRRHDDQFLGLINRIHQVEGLAAVKFLGYVPDHDLVALLHHAVALVFPTRYEGFGLPAVEAMAAGCPVIYHPVAAVTEVVGRAGIPVPENRPEDYVRHIQCLQDQDGIRRQHVMEGVRRAREFSWDHCVERLLAVLREFS
ncbi:MAG: glycosyltransferase family 1 protein [Candidatus Methanomethylicaceae archaeon]